MLKWLRGGNASRRVAVIEALPVDGKRSIILVRRDNIEHLVMVGGRNDLVIEPNIMRRPAPKPARGSTPEWKGLPPPPSAPTREPLAEPSQKGIRYDLEELTRRLETESRRGQSSPSLRTALRSSAQSDATSRDLEPRSKPRFDAGAEPTRTEDPARDPAPEGVPNDTADESPAR
jgi:flagellar protein FliO/FliZ